MDWNRRQLIGGISAVAIGGSALAAHPGSRSGSRAFSPQGGPRTRVLLVNDLAGDVDGLFATAHMLLSTSVDLRGIIASPTFDYRDSAERGATLARELVRLTRHEGRVPVYAGVRSRMNGNAAVQSAGTQAIIDEAKRTDVDGPLYVAVGGGLTEVASALAADPSIAGRITVIWIGGHSYPGVGGPEINMALDAGAARFLFNESLATIWLVPLETYATCVVSVAELQVGMDSGGALGRWLYNRLTDSNGELARAGTNSGGTWTLGDSPLVTLTALTDAVPSLSRPAKRYESTGSSPFDVAPTPILQRDGRYVASEQGRKMRSYRSVDMRLTMADFYAKLRTSAA